VLYRMQRTAAESKKGAMIILQVYKCPRGTAKDSSYNKKCGVPYIRHAFLSSKVKRFRHGSPKGGGFPVLTYRIDRGVRRGGGWLVNLLFFPFAFSFLW